MFVRSRQGSAFADVAVDHAASPWARKVLTNRSALPFVGGQRGRVSGV
jgi:hypothetical protein